MHMCSECYEVSGMENECEDGDASWADAKQRALPILTDCVRKGGNEDRLRSVYPWAYAAPTAAKSTPPTAAKSARASLADRLMSFPDNELIGLTAEWQRRTIRRAAQVEIDRRAAAAKPAPAEAPKRGRGRPRLGGDVATRTVGVRMSQADADALAAIAEAESTTVAELLRPAVAALLARGKV